jgi:hypothetical protein
MNQIPKPRIAAYHAWSLLAIGAFRLERALRIGWLIGSLKWRLVQLAESAYPIQFRRRNELPVEDSEVYQ